MAFNKADVGTFPAMYGTGDNTTLPSGETKIKASDAAANDEFGKAVAVGSNRICVGAYKDDDAGNSSGSAYIFDLDGTQISKITASDSASLDTFGKSVAIGSGRIVVGANGDSTNAGSAYIFDLSGTQVSKITASGAAASDSFGYSVAVGSGRIVVGAYGDDDNGTNSGSAYIFDLGGTQISKIKASDGAANDLFGRAVAVGSGRIVIGAYGDGDDGSNSGSAYIFDLDGTQLAKIKASDAATNDRFGWSVAVRSGRIVIGAYGDSDGGFYSGSAYLFDLDGTQISKIKASDGAINDQFGRSVAIGSGRIVIGSEGDDDVASASGSAYIFDLDGAQLAKITASDAASLDRFGSSVAIGSGRIVVGAYGDSDDGSYSGSAYIWQTPDVITPYEVQDWNREET